MTARDIIAEATGSETVAVDDYPLLCDVILDALCPPGSMRVIDRRPQPCPECNGEGTVMCEGFDDETPCDDCDGEGTVDADRIHGLANVPDGYGAPIRDLWRLVPLGDTEGETR